jgi:hypothetical protein
MQGHSKWYNIIFEELCALGWLSAVNSQTSVSRNLMYSYITGDKDLPYIYVLYDRFHVNTQ